MDSSVTGTGSVFVGLRFVVPGLLLVMGHLAGPAGAQGPVPTYEKAASWAETMAGLRAQTVSQLRLFRPPSAFGPARPGRSQQTSSHPLVALWAQLERDFPLECDWLLQDYAKQTGTFYIQDVYAGPGLAGIRRGTAKKLRVIGLEFRATVVGGNHNRGEAGQAFVATPVAVAQGSWEAKTVLGETIIHDDGSACFTAPARTPLYFQVIDDNGHMMQTMRSWATLQPGENASCVGCHEHKGESPLAIHAGAALRHGARPLEPFYGPPRGFSFSREIQPILDRHCIDCHHDRSRLAWLSETRSRGAAPDEGGAEVAFSLRSDTTTDPVAKRRFSDGYLALTGARLGYDRSLAGTSRPLVNWISPQSGPPMRRPYCAGSATSGLMQLLEDGHKGVRLNREEKEKLACWIDLVVPYCGDYIEANAWGPMERARYEYFLNKRRKMEAAEARNIAELIASREGE